MMMIISCVIVRCVVARKTLKNCISQLCKNNNNHTKSKVHARVRVHRLLLKSSSFSTYSFIFIYNFILLRIWFEYVLYYVPRRFVYFHLASDENCVFHHLNILMPLASKAEAMKPLTPTSGISNATFLAVQYEHPIADNANIDAVRNFMFPMA